MAAEDFLIRFRIDLSSAKADLRQFAQETQQVSRQQFAGQSQALQQANIRGAQSPEDLARTAGAAWAVREREMKIAGATEAERRREQRRMQQLTGGQRFQGVTDDAAEQARLMKIRNDTARVLRTQLKDVTEQAELDRQARFVMAQNLENLQNKERMTSMMTPYANTGDRITEMQEQTASNRFAAGDPLYLDTKTQLDVSERQLSQALYALERTLDQYKASVVNLETEQNLYRAALHEAREKSEDWIASMMRLESEGNRLAARLNDARLGDDDWVANAAGRRISDRERQAAVRSEADTDPRFVAASASMQRTAAFSAEAVAELNASNDLYISSITRLANLNTEIRARREHQLAGDQRYLDTLAELRSANQRASLGARSSAVGFGDFESNQTQRQNVIAEEQGALSGSGRYQSALRDAVTALENNAAILAQSLSTHADYLRALENRTEAENRTALAVRRQRADSGAFVREQVAANRVATAEQASLLGSRTYFETLSGLAVVTNQRRTQEELGLVANRNAIRTAAELAEAQEQRKEQVQREVTANTNASVYRAGRQDASDVFQAQVISQRDLAAIGTRQLATEEQGLRVALATNEERRERLASLRAESNIGKRLYAETVKAQETAQMQTDQGQQLTRLRAQNIAAQVQLNREFQRQIVQEMKAAGAGPIQVMRARMGAFGGGRMEGGGGSAMGIGGFFGGGLMNMARYALPSAFAYGGIHQIANIVSEAEEMERIFKQIEGQLEATDQAAEFPRLQENILQIARDTGNAGQEIAEFAFQLQGAFGGGVQIDGISGIDLVESQLESIAKLNRLTGIDNQKAVDSITALSLAFNTSAEDIGDAAFVVQNEMGVMAEHTIDFMGDVAPVAQDAGFALNDLAAIAGLSQQRSGRSGTALAESWNRVIPAMQGAREELMRIAATSDELRTPEFMAALASGNIRDQLFAIAQAYPQMAEQAQAALLETMGGRREAQVVITALVDGERMQEVLDAINADNENTVGAMEARWVTMTETLSQKTAILGENFRQLGVTLYESGMDTVLIGVIDLLTSLIEVTSEAMSLWGDFNDMLGGVPSVIGAITAAVVALNAALKATTAWQGIGAFAAGGGAAAGAGTAIARTQAMNAGLPLATAAAGGMGGRLPASVLRTAALAGTAIGVALAGAAAAAIGISIGRSGIVPGGTSSEELDEARENMMNQMRDANEAELATWVDDNRNFWQRSFDSMAGFFTGVDTNVHAAAEQVAAERARAGALESIQGLMEDPETGGAIDEIVAQVMAALVAGDPRRGVSEFNQKLNQQAMDEINAWVGADVIAPIYSADPEIEEPVGFSLNQQMLGEQDIDVERLVRNANERNSYGLSLLLQLIGIPLEDQAIIDAGVAEARAEKYAAADLAGRLAMDLEDEGKSIEEAMAAYESGRGSFQTVLNAMRNYENLIRNTMAQGGSNPDLVRQLHEAMATTGKAYADWVMQQDQQYVELTNLASGGSDIEDIQTEIDTLVARMRDPQFTDPESRRDYAMQIADLQRAMYESAVANADSAAEALAIAEAGYDVAVEVQAEILSMQLGSQNVAMRAFMATFQQAAFGLFQGGQIIVYETIDEFMAAVSYAILVGGQAAQDMAAMLRDKLTALSEVYKYAAQFGQTELMESTKAQIDATKAALGAVENADPSRLMPDGVEPIVPTNIRDQETIDQEKERAQREAEQAAREREREAEEAKRKAQDLADARADYAKALIEGDPVRSAQHAINEANRHYREAETEADRIRAMAERIRAERQLQNALREIQDAQIDLLVAQAEYAGDTVRSAELGLEAAREAIARARADFASGAGGEADVIRAEAAVLQAQGRVRDEQLRTRMEDYEYLYEIEQISKQQLIQYLQSLKQIPDLTQDQIRDIDRRIRQLNQELGQDLQFNLPTNLQLPTLYEARRLDQTPGGGGYQDNRNVTITLYVTDGMTADQAAQMVNEAVGGGGRVGTMVRRY